MNPVANRILAVLIPIVGALGLSLTLPSADAQAHLPQDTLWLLDKPCKFEDSVNCYWDADTGNGAGHSFVSRHVKNGNVTCVLYLDKAYARKHDTCFTGTNPARSSRDLDGDSTLG